MKKITLLVLGASLLLTACGSRPIYSGLIDKVYEREGDTIVFHEDTLQIDQYGRLYDIKWLKENAQSAEFIRSHVDDPTSKKEYVTVYVSGVFSPYSTANYTIFGFFRNKNVFVRIDRVGNGTLYCRQ